MADILLKGLDGSNPLAFLAAVGLLRVLDDHAQSTSGERPRLRWEFQGRYYAVVSGPPSLEALFEIVLGDTATWTADDVGFAYDKEGNRVEDTDAKGAIWDLKPPPELWIAELKSIKSNGRKAAFAVGLASDVAVDNNKNTKPTAFHFTAGQQQFLRMVNELRLGLTRAHLEEALVGPWEANSTLPSLSWDSTATRLYALRATNPSNSKRGSVPGADWLAFQGLPLLPSFPKGTRLLTTGITGGWKDGRFEWPLWSPLAGRDTTASLVALPKLHEMSKARRDALGIVCVFRSGIARSDQGGYGSFSPAAVV